MDGLSVYRSLAIEPERSLPGNNRWTGISSYRSQIQGLRRQLGSPRLRDPYGIGLIKNKYIGRTFIEASQKLREEAVGIKLNPLKAVIQGKRVVMIDDSIVRGTTSKRIVMALKNAGAKEVHLRVSSPPITNACYFGIDTPDRHQLIAVNMSVEEIGREIGADSLGFLSQKGLMESIGDLAGSVCTGCFTGDYPMEVPKEASRHLFEKR